MRIILTLLNNILKTTAMNARLYFSFLLILFVTIAQAQTGTLDASFGASGKVHVFPTIRDMA